jgi:hypothetical protein
MTDEQLVAMIRSALERETRAIVPAPGLAGAIREELARPAVRQRPSWWRSIGAAAWALATLATIAGIGLAVGTLRHGPAPPQVTTATTDAVPTHPSRRGHLRVGPPAGPLTANPNTFQGAAIPRTVKLVAQTPDPAGGLPWGLRVFRTTRGWVCVQVGRVQSATIGVIGQDGAWNNDGRFHPISPNAYTADSCNPTGPGDRAFINVAANSAIASADVPWGTGPQSGQCRLGNSFRRLPLCPPGDLRNLNYGLLGPSATSITYVSDGHTYTEPTNGRDGAYLIVARSSPPPCTMHGRGRGCVSPGGRFASAAVRAGVITTTTYRDGHTCTLPTSTATGVQEASCPPYTRTVTARTTTAGTVISSGTAIAPNRAGFPPANARTVTVGGGTTISNAQPPPSAPPAGSSTITSPASSAHTTP